MSAKPLAIPYLSSLPRRAFSVPWTTSACMVMADVVALTFVYWAAVFIRYSLNARFQLSHYMQLYPAVSLFIAGFFIQDLYPGILQHPAEEMRRVFRCITTVFLLISSTTFVWHNADAYSRFVILLSWALGAPFVLLARQATRMLLSSQPWWGVPAVILGSEGSARRVIQALEKERSGLRIMGVLTDGRMSDEWNSKMPPVLGPLEAASSVAQKNIAHYAIVAMSDGDNRELRHAIHEYCAGYRHVLLLPNLEGLCSLHISARVIGTELALEVPQRLFHKSASIAKRTLDVIGCSAVLLMLLPLFCLVTLLIRITSPGPIFFGHTRFGRDGSKFKAWKFRTMVTNGDEVLENYLAEHPEARAEWERDHKLKNDPRVTSVGKWLRRGSIDELPQLWNVLVGNMSLVGPRPIVKAEIDKYGAAYDLYKRVIPGITGLWQVSGRNNTSYEERVAFDEYYVRNWSVWLDAYILARTVRTVLTGDGAY